MNQEIDTDNEKIFLFDQVIETVPKKMESWPPKNDHENRLISFQ